MGAIARWRAVEREAAQLFDLHGDDAGHFVAPPELIAEARKGWGRLAGAIGRARILLAVPQVGADP